MAWNDIKARIRDRYEWCKDYVVEHPVKTALGVLTVGLGGFGIYKLCNVPQQEVISIVSRNTVSQQQFTQTLTNPCETMSELSTRAYNWHEESHLVHEHLRHLSDGRVIPVSAYTKVTGGKV